MMFEAVEEKRFDDCQALNPLEVLTGNGEPYTPKDSRIVARQLGLEFIGLEFSYTPATGRIPRWKTKRPKAHDMVRSSCERFGKTSGFSLKTATMVVRMPTAHSTEASDGQSKQPNRRRQGDR